MQATTKWKTIRENVGNVQNKKPGLPRYLLLLEYLSMNECYGTKNASGYSRIKKVPTSKSRY